MVRTVVMNTLWSLYDRAAESFRKEPNGDHYFESVHAAMVAIQHASRVDDALLAEIVGGVEPRYYVKALCLHREQQKHLTRWDD